MAKAKVKLNYGELNAALLPHLEALGHRLAAQASSVSGETYEVVSGINVRGKQPRRAHVGVGGDYLREIETDALQKALGMVR